MRRIGVIGAAFVAGALALAAYGCGGNGAAAATPAGNRIATITLSPQAVTLPNPVSAHGRGSAKRIAVSLAALDSSGRPITGPFATPIRIRVYAQRPGELSTARAVISAPERQIYFTYDGGPVANSIVVTAVAGRAFALMSFQPRNRGLPGGQSVDFPMPDAARNIARGWGFQASIGGGPAHYVEMDTGSRGIVVPASALGPSAVGPGPAGMIEYTSDGKEFLGNYYLAPVKLSFGGVGVTTVPIRVLGVSRAACAPGYPNCRVGGIGGLGVMGVGFDRGKSSPMPPELTNPFLALQNVIQGQMDPGYLIRAGGVTLGITSADAAGFDEVALQSGGSGPGDWNTAPGCFSFPEIAGYPAQCGTVLMDTGIASAILGLPRPQRPPGIAARIPDGESVQIAVGSRGASPILSYGFAVGDGGPTTPTRLRWAGDPSAFVNTGRRVISSYDYLYDAGSGRLGFRPAGG